MAPVQFKGEIMDFDLGVEIDHRKRRRNRTTQSCLNCHTSKRKCDRKRPCQRCIQLGLTGLCVYEVDDPAARDDPNIDETTRLRNRIAELESLVRELRGKPHPRWADPNFCDGDASEKWHSRSTRRTALFQRQRNQSQSAGGVKPEQNGDQQQQPQLYRMSPSPAPQLAFDGTPCAPTGDLQYSPSSSSSSSMSYPNTRQSSLSMSASDVYYHQPYGMRSPESPESTCTCLTNPAAGAPLISLTHQLQNTIELLRQLPEHAARHNCTILKRIAQLNDLMHGGSGEGTPPTPFDGLSTPDSELLSPVSTSSHASMAASIHHDWPAISAAPGQYDSYFPVSPGDPSMYHKSYHIN
ncbi:Zn(II)2Cys6 transcription factor [Phanerochaete sordida]|uniref:Zn(II)2Cys6 transcription factor n=1 Tax=Phanerochaete sordida TaxID=48140 RepID=A0A9P3GBI3_9APHY|nr:Zn(II)2Cys6 transcription factor [Phanerochaete sordida]